MTEGSGSWWFFPSVDSVRRMYDKIKNVFKTRK